MVYDPEYPHIDHDNIPQRPVRGQLEPFIVKKEAGKPDIYPGTDHYPPERPNDGAQPILKRQATAPPDHYPPERPNDGPKPILKRQATAHPHQQICGRAPRKKRKRKRTRRKKVVRRRRRRQRNGPQQQNSVIRSRQYPAIVVDCMKKCGTGVTLSQILKHFAARYLLKFECHKIERVLDWMKNHGIIAQRPCGRWELLKNPTCGCWAPPVSISNCPGRASSQCARRRRRQPRRRTKKRRKPRKRRKTKSNGPCRVQNVNPRDRDFDAMVNHVNEGLGPSSVKPSTNVYYEPDEYDYQPVRRYEDRRKVNYDWYDSVPECQPGRSHTDYEYQPVRRYMYEPVHEHVREPPTRSQYDQQPYRRYQQRNQNHYNIGSFF